MNPDLKIEELREIRQSLISKADDLSDEIADLERDKLLRETCRQGKHPESMVKPGQLWYMSTFGEGKEGVVRVVSASALRYSVERIEDKETFTVEIPNACPRCGKAGVY